VLPADRLVQASHTQMCEALMLQERRPLPVRLRPCLQRLACNLRMPTGVNAFLLDPATVAAFAFADRQLPALDRVQLGLRPGDGFLRGGRARFDTAPQARCVRYAQRGNKIPGVIFGLLPYARRDLRFTPPLKNQQRYAQARAADQAAKAGH